MKKAIFQQDGAKPHTSNENLLFLRTKFGKCVISSRFPNLFHCGWFWSPYSPDRNVCDFFLWRYLKDRVYENNPQTLDQLENEVLRVMLDIPSGIFELVVRNLSASWRKTVDISNNFHNGKNCAALVNIFVFFWGIFSLINKLANDF